jgi:hypothetical protein
MPVFTSEEDFKKFDTYKANLKKAANQVAASGKTFVYFKEYTFADKKQPLVLIDVPNTLKGKLNEGKVKPTASGTVTLTEASELKFDAEKGKLNRAKVKAALARIGIPNVYVAPGETEDEDPSETGESQTPPPVEREVPLSPQMQRKLDFEQKAFDERQKTAQPVAPAPQTTNPQVSPPVTGTPLGQTPTPTKGPTTLPQRPPPPQGAPKTAPILPPVSQPQTTATPATKMAPTGTIPPPPQKTSPKVVPPAQNPVSTAPQTSTPVMPPLPKTPVPQSDFRPLAKPSVPMPGLPPLPKVPGPGTATTVPQPGGPPPTKTPPTVPVTTAPSQTPASSNPTWKAASLSDYMVTTRKWNNARAASEAGINALKKAMVDASDDSLKEAVKGALGSIDRKIASELKPDEFTKLIDAASIENDPELQREKNRALCTGAAFRVRDINNKRLVQLLDTTPFGSFSIIEPLRSALDEIRATFVDS